jgi:predicted adenylyl cyclase CyaB
MPHLNIEIKARCYNPQTIRDILSAHHADFRGTDHQIDTYFKVLHGRLKLREGNIENALIYYEREDQEGPKQSTVTLVPTTPGTPLKALLTQALGVLMVVEKHRDIYFIDNVKFHIDDVCDLGTFVEIEAIDYDGSIRSETLRAQCHEFLSLLNIQPGQLVALSYSDLLLHRVECWKCV